MKTLYFDTFSGISGDMAVGALIDAGVPLVYLKKELAKLGISGLSVSASKVKRGGISATAFTVRVPKGEKSRDFAAIRRLLGKSRLSGRVKEISIGIFSVLARAEAKVHGVDVEKVHFHEVGAADSIADIVCTAAGIEKLGISRFVASPLPLCGGTVKTSHGMMPLPAPATVEVLKGIPVRGGGSRQPMELVTPTGAAIVAALCSDFGEIPLMKVSSVGYGSGTMVRDDGTPNLLRIVTGEEIGSVKSLVVIEANMDDITPEALAEAQSRVMEGGALDAWITPVVMKKGRPGWTFSVLCEPSRSQDLREMVLGSTTTIGVREYRVDRHELERRSETFATRFGRIRVKVSTTPSGNLRIKPEYEDVAAASRRKGIPFDVVHAEAVDCARAKLEKG